MKVFATDHFTLPLPSGHTFPVAKYALLRQQILEFGIVNPSSVLNAPAATDDQLLLVHDPAYLKRVVAGSLSPDEVRKIGLPWSPELVERSRRSVGATIAGARAAIDEGVAVNLAGGTHHAFADQGGGYCVFNDAAVAARVLQAEALVEQVLIIDLDVHQGDGTAALFANDPSVFTLSVHGARNYPLRKQKSDLDLELPDKADDQAYLNAVTTGLRESFHRFQPDLAIYLAGADPYQQDRLGRLAVSEAGLAQRDRIVFDHCLKDELPVVMVMAGGYARNINDTVAIQVQSVRAAAELFKRFWPG